MVKKIMLVNTDCLKKKLYNGQTFVTTCEKVGIRSH